MIVWLFLNIILFISNWRISGYLRFASVPERLAASALFSCAILQIIPWMLSLSRVLRPFPYGTIIVIFFIITFCFCRNPIYDDKKLNKINIFNISDGFYTHIILGFGMFIWILFVFLTFFRITLMPPVGVDPLTYQCVFPAIWLQESSCWHSFVAPDYRLNFQPVCGELISFFNVLFLGTDTFIELHQLEAFVVLCFVAYAISRFLGANRLWAVIAIIYLLSIPQLTAETSIVKNNVFMIAALLSGILFFFRLIKWLSPIDALLAGIGLGLAAGTKIHGAVIAIIFNGILASILIISLKKEWVQCQPKKLILIIGLILIGETLMFGPRLIQIYFNMGGISDFLLSLEKSGHHTSSFLDNFLGNVPGLSFRWFVAPFSRTYHSWGAFNSTFGHCGIPFAIAVFPSCMIWLIYAFRSFRHLDISEVFIFFIVMGCIIGIVAFLSGLKSDRMMFAYYTVFPILFGIMASAFVSKYLRPPAWLCSFLLIFAIIGSMGPLLFDIEFRIRDQIDEKKPLKWASVTYRYFMKLSPCERTSARLGSMLSKNMPGYSLLPTHEWEKSVSSGTKILYTGGIPYPIYGNDFSRYVGVAMNFEGLQKELKKYRYDWIVVGKEQTQIHQYLKRLSNYELRFLPLENGAFSRWSSAFYIHTSENTVK